MGAASGLNVAGLGNGLSKVRLKDRKPIGPHRSIKFSGTNGRGADNLVNFMI